MWTRDDLGVMKSVWLDWLRHEDSNLSFRDQSPVSYR